MPDSIDFGPEAGLNSRLAVLRQLERAPHPIVAEELVVPGFYIALDPEALTTVTLASEPGSLLSAHYEVQGHARWLGLHLDMSDCALAGKSLFGVAIRSLADPSTTFRLCLRNGREGGGFDDHFFRKTAIAYPQSSLHLDAITLAEEPSLWSHAPWRELILFLKPESGAIDLIDLKVFVL